MSSLTQQITPSRKLISLWLLIGICSLPLISAWLFYLNPDWLPTGRSNNGVLIDPQRPIASLSLNTIEQIPFDWQSLHDKWTLVVVSESGCDAACVETLIKIRQIRRATAAGRQRIERGLIIYPDNNGNIDIPSLDGLDGTHLLIAKHEQREAVTSLFPLADFEDSVPVFIIDPRGDLMMRYDTPQITSKQILADLEKLLKASQNWSQGGQYGHQ